MRSVLLVAMLLLARGERASRHEMAVAYLRFERALAAHPPPAERIAELNRAFDIASMAFLGGRTKEALEGLEQLTASLGGSDWTPFGRPRPPLKEAREGNEARLRRIAKPELADATASCLARNALLVDEPSPERSAEFLADPVALAREVAGEVEALEAGKDPYVGKRGDHWTVVRTGPGDVPCRLYVPEAPEAKGPFPVVVALHGAGGDENLFFDGYGAGRIKSLAAERGLVVAAPATYAIAANPALLDALLDRLAALHPIDGKRVYVLGHSLGAMAAAGLADSPRVAAVCCIAGGGVVSTKQACPMLVVAGGLDPIFPADRLARAQALARAMGVEVEMRIKGDWGHTLIVGEFLPEALDWLLARSRK